MDAPQQVGARFIAPRTVANAPPHQTGHNALAARRPPHRPNAPDDGGNTDGGGGRMRALPPSRLRRASTSPLKRLPATAGEAVLRLSASALPPRGRLTFGPLSEGRRKTKHRFVFRSRKLPVGLRRGKAVLRLFRLRPSQREACFWLPLRGSCRRSRLREGCGRPARATAGKMPARLNVKRRAGVLSRRRGCRGFLWAGW